MPSPELLTYLWLRWRLSSKLPGPSRTKIVDTVKNLVEEKTNFSISEVSDDTMKSLPELVNTVER